LRLVTPVPTSIARPLIEGLRTEVVCISSQAAQLFPAIRPVSYAGAVERALKRELPDESLIDNIASYPSHVLLRREGILCDVRQTKTDVSANGLFSVIQELGGASGYLYANILWRLRGWVDRCVGGVGMSGKGNTGPLRKGDRVHFWYVQELEPGSRLLLRAEMKLPGRAWLEFRLLPQTAGKTLIRCCAWFEPRGLVGELYWWFLYPIHLLIFRGMLQAVCRRAAGSECGQSAMAAH
jgi:hypothetical protein